MRSSNSSHVTHGSQTMRTPVAWYHRDVHLSRPTSRQYAPQMAHSHPVSGINQRTSSPSLTTTSSDDREEVPIVRHPLKRQSRQSHNLTVDRRSVISKISRKPNGHQVFPSNMINGEPGFGFAPPAVPINVYRTGTLRSSRSVPGFMMSAANTWDGEPCPVHGSGPHSPLHGVSMSPVSVAPQMTMKRFSSVADIRTAGNNFFPMMTIVPPMTTDGKHIGNQLVPGPQRPFFVPAFSDQMPIRDNFKVSTPLPSLPSLASPEIASKMKQMDGYPSEDVCCKGHLIVLWIILGVVTIGVISGIILGVTVN